MTEKWFRSRSVCSAETQAAQEAAEEGGDQMNFSDLAGVFYTLAVGVAAGMVVLFLELIYASYKDTRSKDAQAPKSVLRSSLAKTESNQGKDSRSLQRRRSQQR
ncbi:hypothetical protein OS493_004474 [Desmophyllum pertusum]|uniref:Uncharacterized protein n=1 Tax=Desmophyllum pertusum TaxID=174260 RepID=A0A9X0CZ69_9CNID|nr:hypothetical protein OS493_004474 [Desmophyllum pertusum]